MGNPGGAQACGKARSASSRQHVLSPAVVVTVGSVSPNSHPACSRPAVDRRSHDQKPCAACFCCVDPLGGMHSAAALKFYLYSQLEVITAKMLGKYVPRGGTGARVIQLGGGTRELYYYPKDVVLVTNVGEKVNKGAREKGSVEEGGQ